MGMDLHSFRETLVEAQPPSGIPSNLRALWYDGKQDWETAHTIVQDLSDREGAWVHAYLHRKEGDLWNANYWYQRASKVMPDKSLEEEWEDLVQAMLAP